MDSGAGALRVLDDSDLAACLELTRAANWNQNANDWRMMLGHGTGWGIETDDGGSLAASTVVLPFEGVESFPSGQRFAWISMVLVLPQLRRRGLASQLLTHALQWLRERETLPILDATPAGEPVYRSAGFVPSLGFRRYRRAPRMATQVAAESTAQSMVRTISRRIRPVEAGDWGALLDLDGSVFGGDRSTILRSLAQRVPASAFLVEDHRQVGGFVFAREGHTMHQIGPLVAADDGAALALLDAALMQITGPACVDLMDHRAALQPELIARGFVFERPFRRMLLAGGRALPGDATSVALVAGPELG